MMRTAWVGQVSAAAGAARRRKQRRREDLRTRMTRS
jgi:hypothetical protein